MLRRPLPSRLAESWQAEARAAQVLHDLRRRRGDGPLLLRLPRRYLALVLTARDARRILAESPEPFAPASLEKRAALGHFQPDGVLVSRGPLRRRRRDLNEAALQLDRPLHEAAGAFDHAVHTELSTLFAAAPTHVPWPRFHAAVWRVFRRVLFGPDAAGDTELTTLLDQLRRRANWAYAGVPRRGRRAALAQRVSAYVDRAPPGTLAHAARRAADASGPEGRVDPAGQLPHWMFAFDAVALALVRTLAVLSTHPRELAWVRAEIDEADPGELQVLPRVRAAVQESLRLWPTTLVLLRDGIAETDWDGAVAPAGTSFVIVTSFLHRDPENVPFADRFDPHAWLDGRADAVAGLVPFSAGPARCPGRDVVLHLASTILAAFLRRHQPLLLTPSRLDPARPLPVNLDHFTLDFQLLRR